MADASRVYEAGGNRLAEPVALRPPRLHVASFEGTWGGGVLSSRKTVTAELVKLISKAENVFEHCLSGVGSDVSRVDRFLGGLGGWGTLRNVIVAYRNIANQYMPGDRIILIGYSRGAWAARYLAMVIGLVGLPKDADARFCHRLYKACDKNTIGHVDVLNKLKYGHDFWTDVKIDALCCFDTVGSLGLPITGVAKPLAFLRGLAGRKSEIVGEVTDNVEHAFHCLALHEVREPYSPVVMSGSNVRQVFFPGNHTNIGRISDGEGLGHAPLAWMIQQLSTHLGICFDPIKLRSRFPHYRPAPPQINVAADASPPIQAPGEPMLPRWYQARIYHTSSSRLALMGKKSREPGRTHSQGSDVSAKIHIGARLRIDTDDMNAVPGYTLMLPLTGRHYWAKRRARTHSSWRRDRRGRSSRERVATMHSSYQGGDSSSGGGSGSGSLNGDAGLNQRGSWNQQVAERIEEAEVGVLEAQLLGLPGEASALP